MILDTMNKNEVMRAIRKDFDEDVLPYYQSVLRLKIGRIIQSKAMRLKSVVNLGWVEYVSKNRIKYHILQRGNQYEDLPLFISECTWRKRCGKPQTFFATLHPNSTIVVYTQHCLERYAERVLRKNDISLRDTLSCILKKQTHAFHIVLPSPTHKYTLYHGISSALFLGDYEPPHDCNEPAHNWYNTCISTTETGQSQHKILTSLYKLQSFIRDYKFNPIESSQSTERFVLKYTNENDKKRLVEFLQISYMLMQLHLSFRMPFTFIFNEYINTLMTNISNQLNELGESFEHLSPFDEVIGIAHKGELDYIETN